MLEKRFWSKVNRPSLHKCWEWTSGTNNNGYGQFTVNAKIGKRLSHRLAYADKHGPIPHGMNVLHKCDNRLCVNPGHLFLGTQKDNMQDMLAKGRRTYTNPRGEKNGRAILTPEQVTELRIAYVRGETSAALANRFGVAIGVVYPIISGRNWKHLIGLDGHPSRDELKAAADYASARARSRPR
jgi:hypothetical protein